MGGTHLPTQETLQNQEPVPSNEPPAEIVDVTFPHPSEPPPEFDGVSVLDLPNPELPNYDGPIPVGHVLIETIALLSDNNNPEFPTTFPTRLQDLIPNLTFHNRITAVNNALSSPRLKFSFWLLRFHRVVFLGLASAVIAVLFNLKRQDIFWGIPAFLCVVVFLMLAGSRPITTKYIRTIELFAEQWSDQDKLRGLMYVVRKEVPVGFKTLIKVKIAILEERTVAGERAGPVQDALPEYSQC
ncbi:hypothetical protein BDR26DRAFT_865229 [Obelidium mucronatum]|nr:hypothetical protein BDR26DRAFT_865229 [Obelidium mucronatum]